MFDCEFWDYCGNDCKTCKYAKQKMRQKELAEATKNFNAVICKSFEPLLSAIDKAIEKILERKNNNEKH